MTMATAASQFSAAGIARERNTTEEVYYELRMTENCSLRLKGRDRLKPSYHTSSTKNRVVFESDFVSA